ncbi:hypothetical protein ES319_A05G178300v1 [Gossypium barbadense]|uniref:Uncharacterized protein n=2 Tax=Gossypium TaxID=3633 RepID=A0A5J5VSW1_GOSBA|nr:hypothetical protein ES319_A05G178300v1 [Gossypium barbadense]TYH17309.1 hypothetical protein ES288_A05G182100v1 [Gossypium darwinii]
MGNCIRREKSTWADDETSWSLQSSQMGGDYGDNEINIMEKETRQLFGGKTDAINTREVKITISKKELEQLVHKVEMQGLTLEPLLLARMVKGGGGGDMFEFEQPRSWKPVLQSIPEVN